MSTSVEGTILKKVTKGLCGLTDPKEGGVTCAATEDDEVSGGDPGSEKVTLIEISTGEGRVIEISGG